MHRCTGTTWIPDLDTQMMLNFFSLSLCQNSQKKKTLSSWILLLIVPWMHAGTQPLFFFIFYSTTLMRLVGSLVYLPTTLLSYK